MHKLTLLIAFLCFFGGSIIAGAAEAPDFTLEDLNGDLFTLSDHLGEGPVLLSFWATWCKPCKDELPHLQDIYEKYSEKGLTLITISEDSPKTQAKVRPYVRARGFTFPVLLDPDQEVLQLFQGSTLPLRVLIDRDGTILETHQGYNPGDEVGLENEILQLLNPEPADEE
jgi:peroxiredoxin